jgi:dihydroneopterin aldolase
MTNKPDVIFLERMQFFGYHGFHAEEQRLGQRFEVDLSIETSTKAAGLTDELPDTVSYSQLYAIARDIVEGAPKKLIEAVAEEIALAVLRLDARVESATVTVRKPNAPIKGAVFGAAGVQIHRDREARST